MLGRENTKDLVSESLPDRLHAIEVQNHGLEAIDACKHTFSLRSRDQLVLSILREANRNHGFGEPVVLILARECVEDLSLGPRRVVAQLHSDQRSLLQILAVSQNPIDRISELV